MQPEFAGRQCKGMLMKIRAQKGGVLIEALVAILIFSFGVLALFGIQSRAIKNISQANHRSTAVYMAGQIIATAQADINHLNDYQTANDKVVAWVDQVKAALPNGDATVTSVQDTAPASNNGTISVNITWRLPDEPNGHQHTVSTYVSY